MFDIASRVEAVMPWTARSLLTNRAGMHTCQARDLTESNNVSNTVRPTT